MFFFQRMIFIMIFMFIFTFRIQGSKIIFSNRRKYLNWCIKYRHSKMGWDSLTQRKPEGKYPTWTRNFCPIKKNRLICNLTFFFFWGWVNPWLSPLTLDQTHFFTTKFLLKKFGLHAWLGARYVEAQSTALPS